MRPTQADAIPPRRLAHRGFSLLELMLVMAIIGILMAVAAVSITGYGARAKISGTKATMFTVRNALESYNLTNSAFPAGLETLKSGPAPYLDASKAIADGWGKAFFYNTPGGNGQPFDLISGGPDMRIGTADDINIWTMEKKE